MKKNFKRKNYVLIGAIGIAAVALTSVGFATWITGITQNTVTTEGISIEVDTVNNKTSYIEAAVGADEKIKIGEQNVSSTTNGILYVENTIAPDFDVTLTNFRVITSTNFTITNVGISLAIYDSDGRTPATGVSVNGVGIYPNLLDGEDNTGEGAKKTYIALTKSTLTTGENGGLTPISSGSAGYVADYNCYTLSNMNLTFAWGSAFELKEPTEYYNDMNKDVTKFEDKLANVQKATNRLTKMKTDLNGKKLKITFTLNGSYSNQNN